MKIVIPKREHIEGTGFEDPVDMYYKPIIRNFYLRRLEIAMNVLDKENKENVLEIGYGSGILFCELNRRFRNIFGIDLHLNASLVNDMLSKEN